MVLAEEEAHGQLPDRREIERLVEVALGARAVSEERDADLLRSAHARRERRADGAGRARADDPRLAEAADREIREVHRAAAPAAHPAAHPEQLRE
jgi:hypothetical protein